MGRRGWRVEGGWGLDQLVTPPDKEPFWMCSCIRKDLISSSVHPSCWWLTNSSARDTPPRDEWPEWVVSCVLFVVMNLTNGMCGGGGAMREQWEAWRHAGHSVVCLRSWECLNEWQLSVVLVSWGGSKRFYSSNVLYPTRSLWTTKSSDRARVSYAQGIFKRHIRKY